MEQRTGLVTRRGNPVTLLGPEIGPGDQAPDFTLLKNDFSPAALSDFKGKVIVLSVVRSLDTSVCDTQTRRFNEQAAALGGDVVVLTISADLPFAQARWCGAAGVDRVLTLSDHRDVSFGAAYGMLIDGERLLARGVFVIDKSGLIQYKQIVKEISTEPDYDAVLEAVKKLL